MLPSWLNYVYILAICMGACPELFSQNIKRVALLVGVEDYEKRGFGNLQFSEDDMTALAAELKKQGFEVTLLLGSEKASKKANFKNVRDTIVKQFLPRLKELGKQDISLVALAGHGRHQQVSTNGQVSEDHFFCPCDAHDADESTWISLSGLIRDIEMASGSERNLILVDACRDNPNRGRGVDGKGFSLGRDAVAVLFASSYSEQAYEPEELKHGLFTYYVIDALSGSARNFDNEVTWDSLVDYVKGRVESESLKLKRNNKVSGVQRPNSIGNLRGQSPVLARLGEKANRNQEFANYYLEHSRIRDASTDTTFDEYAKIISPKVRGTSLLLALEALRLESLFFRNAKVIDQLSAIRESANKIEPNSQHTRMINAMHLRMLKKSDDALAEYSAVIKENPLLVDAYLGIAWIKTEGDSKTKDGAEFTKMLLKKFPKDYRVYNANGTRLFNDGEFIDGLQYLEKSIELEPNSALLWNNKGYGLSNAKRDDDAIKAYRKAGELAWNRDAWILSNVAELFATNKDFSTARKFALQASKLAPTLPDPWETLAMEKYEVKDFQGAIDKLTEGILIKPSPRLLARRIQLNLERNDVSAAAEDVIRLELLSDDIIVWGPPKFSVLSAQSKVTAAVNLADQIISEAEKRKLSADAIAYYRKQKQQLQSR